MKSTHLLHTGPIGQYSSSETVFVFRKSNSNFVQCEKSYESLNWAIINFKIREKDVGMQKWWFY